MIQRVLKFLKSNLGSFIMVSCTVVSVIVSIKTYRDQQEFKESYNRSAQQVLINAEDIEVSDIDNLYDIVHQSNLMPISNKEIAVLANSMDSNYKVVEQLKVTNFPNNQALNYQILRLNMQADISAVQEAFEQYKSQKGQYLLKGTARKSMLRLLSEMRANNRRDRKTIKDGRHLKDATLMKSDSNFYHTYKKELLK